MDVLTNELSLKEEVVKETAPFHSISRFTKEAVGIPENEPAAIMVHITRGDLGYSVLEKGFVNVSGRGTLAPINENPFPHEGIGVPSILEGKAGEHGENIMMVVFCVPSRFLRKDTASNYGYWVDNPLPQGEHPELWKVYNRIAIEYNDMSGEPSKMAKDSPKLYPVYIPKQYVLMAPTPTSK